MALNEFGTNPMGSPIRPVHLNQGNFTFVAGIFAKTGDMKGRLLRRNDGIRALATVEISDNAYSEIYTLIEEGKSKLTKKLGQPRRSSPSRKTMTGSIQHLSRARIISWAQVLSIPSCSSAPRHSQNRSPFQKSGSLIWNSEQEWDHRRRGAISHTDGAGVAGDLRESKAEGPTSSGILSCATAWSHVA